MYDKASRCFQCAYRGVYKSLLSEFVFFSLLQKCNMSAFSFRVKNSSVLLYGSQLLTPANQKPQSAPFSHLWEMGSHAVFPNAALAAADFWSGAAQRGPNVRIYIRFVIFRHEPRNSGGERQDDTSKVHRVVFLSSLIACGLWGVISGGKRSWDAVRAAVCSCSV